METNNIPPQIPEDAKVVKKEVENKQIEEVIQKEENVAAPEVQPKSNDKSIALAIIAIVLGCLVYFLRGLAIYSVGFAFVVFVLSIISAVLALISYKKEMMVSLVALIIGLSSCGSSLSLLTGFIAEAFFAPIPETVSEDYSDIFGNDYQDPFSQFENGTDGDSDYLWD